jgi:FtsH-binding integral membrane protein
MDGSLKLILIWLFVGAFTGWFYWGVLFAFCSGFYLKWKKANKIEKPLLIFVHSTFVPTMALILLAVYAVYNALIGELSLWFLLGALCPVPFLIYGMKTKNDE